MTLFRIIKIVIIIAHYRLDLLLPSRKWFLFFSFFRFINPRCWRVGKRYNTGECLRLALEKLGPIFIKFGQILSTRRDLLPNDIAIELEKLQDKLAPFPSEQAIDILEKAYQQPLNTIFKQFDFEPLASASIAQVHTATLPNNENVVVKIVRPNIKRQIKKDIHVLYALARCFHFFYKSSRNLRPIEIVSEFEKTIMNELNMLYEGANATQLRRDFIDSEIIYVPKVYLDYSTKNILVMERVYGIKISNIETLHDKNVNLKKLSEDGVKIFMMQAFQNRFFHADMHPGNVLVDITDPQNPKYCAVDFGIVGTLSENDQRYLAENFLAFFNQDYRRIAELHVESSWVPKNINVEDFTAMLRSVLEPIYQKPIGEISFAQLLLNLFQTARQFNMQVQPQLLLLQKTLFNIEGLGRELYPHLDLWKTVKPFLENWMREQYSPKTILKKLKNNLPFYLEKFPEIPKQFYDFLQYERQNAKSLHCLKRQYNEIKQKNNYLLITCISLSIALIGTLVVLLSF